MAFGLRRLIRPASISAFAGCPLSGVKRTFEHSAANVRRSRLALIEDESDLVLDGHVLTAVSRQVVVNGEPGDFAFDANMHGRYGPDLCYRCQ